jgi:hypothetical protein
MFVFGECRGGMNLGRKKHDEQMIINIMQSLSTQGCAFLVEGL